MKLICEALVKFLLGVVLVGAFVFLPAGTLDYLQGIVFVLLLFVPMFIAGLVMIIKDPGFLKKRLDNKA